MANFDELLSGIHDSVADTLTAQSNIIVIDSKRQFNPVDFDTVIAYEGDINSQIITFQLPKTHENHELAGCTDKILKWKNLVSGIEGTFKLKPISVDEDSEHLYLQWEVAPEAFSEAGNIEISISFYDYIGEALVFSWNTGIYSELSVGKSNAAVGYNLPAKNEILMIDKDTKQILAPAEYNNTICNFGDVGVSTVYFLTERYLGKNNSLDVMEENTTINLYIILNGHRRKQDIPKDKIRLYTAENSYREKDGLVLIEWDVPSEITSNETFGAGNLEVAIEFMTNDKGVKRWLSNPYRNLKINPSIVQINVEPGDPILTEDAIFELIDNYFAVHEFIFE